jgi:cobyrinic acid a,c-diamide synthase
VLRDRVFSFYYPENLEALRAAGAALVFVDSLADEVLPEVDALYIGGGFPEVFMEELEANASLRAQIRGRVEDGMPVYAECAGLIYLSRRVHWGERHAEMAGVLPCEVEMTPKPQGHGYAVAEVVGENPFFPVGQELKGHEFHNTRVISLDAGSEIYSYRVRRGSDFGGAGRPRPDGLTLGNVLASYLHLHALAVPGWADGLVNAAREYRAKHHGQHSPRSGTDFDDRQRSKADS